MQKIKVTILNEFRHEKNIPAVAELYPEGLHVAIGKGISAEDLEIRYASLDEPEHGLTDEVLADTDVMLWWAHGGHQQVTDEIAQMVAESVRKGMGIIFLHSSHLAKPFRFLVGTSCTLHWRENGDWERLWVVNPSHPIAQGIGEYVRIPHEEVYAEPFGIPEPEQLVFIGNYEGGEVFRSGCCWHRENGKVFYFQPGHETYPTYYVPGVQQIIKNAIRWAYSPYRVSEITCPKVTPPQD